MPDITFVQKGHDRIGAALAALDTLGRLIAQQPNLADVSSAGMGALISCLREQASDGLGFSRFALVIDDGAEIFSGSSRKRRGHRKKPVLRLVENHE